MCVQSTKPMRVAAPRSAPRRPPPFRRFNKLISISFSKVPNAVQVAQLHLMCWLNIVFAQECNTLARHDVTPIPGVPVRLYLCVLVVPCSLMTTVIRFHGYDKQ